MSPATSPPARPLLFLAAAWCAGSFAGASTWLVPEAALGAGCALLVGAALLRSAATRRAAVLSALALLAAARAGTALRALEPAAASPTFEEGARVELAPTNSTRLYARAPLSDPRATRAGGAPRECLPDELVRIEPGTGFLHLARPLAELRSAALGRIERLRDRSARALCAALLLGDTSFFEPGEQDRYVRTGTYHLLVVSGTQVVLLSWLVFAPLARALAGLFERLTRRRLRPELVALPAIALYVPLAGADAPVLRAALVFALVPFAPRSNAHAVPRRCDPLTLWSAALCCECAWNPCAAASLSVELSYAATLGLILGSGALLVHGRAWFGAPGLAPVDGLGRARPEFLRVASLRAGLALRTALAASLVAVLATAALVLARFGELCPSGVLSTVLLLPPTSVLLVLAALHAFLGLPVPEVLLELPARATEAIVRAFDALPLSPGALPPRPFLLWAATALLVLVAIRCREARRAHTALRAAAALLGLALLPWTSAPRALEVVALDVGHGTCAALREPDGSAWVFDAGSRDRAGVARGALGPLLASWDPSAVRFALSHPDRDHDGALDWTLERYSPALWVGAEPAHPGERPAHALPRIDLEGPGVLELVGVSAGKAWLVRGGHEEGNEGSRSLVLERPDGLVWLSGDAVEDGLRGLVGLRPCPGKPVRVLLLPHHGGESPELGALLSALRPAEVWISSSETPASAPEVLRRGIPLRWTGRDGPLVLDEHLP